VLFAIVLAFMLWSRYGAVLLAGAAGNRLQFEETPPTDIHALELLKDGAGVVEEAWVDGR
jgi:hypothetical protein